MKIDEHNHLLNNLQSLLEKQIDLARKGNFNGVEVLTEQAGSDIEKLFKKKPIGRSDIKNRSENLLKLYKKLELMLAAEKLTIKKQQEQVDNVRKIISAYRNSG